MSGLEVSDILTLPIQIRILDEPASDCCDLKIERQKLFENMKVVHVLVQRFLDNWDFDPVQNGANGDELNKTLMAPIVTCCSCAFFSGSQYLKCAPNPSGNAQTCADYLKK